MSSLWLSGLPALPPLLVGHKCAPEFELAKWSHLIGAPTHCSAPDQYKVVVVVVVVLSMSGYHIGRPLSLVHSHTHKTIAKDKETSHN